MLILSTKMQEIKSSFLILPTFFLIDNVTQGFSRCSEKVNETIMVMVEDYTLANWLVSVTHC